MCNNTPRFVHLHTHTEASPDGLTPVDQLVARAAALGYDSLAMTDHGTLANLHLFCFFPKMGERNKYLTKIRFYSIVTS
jgi:DNA polymerase III alpha subunit